MNNCWYEFCTSFCEHIILEGPIRGLTQINLLNMQTQDEAMLPEAVRLFVQELQMQPYRDLDPWEWLHGNVIDGGAGS